MSETQDKGLPTSTPDHRPFIQGIQLSSPKAFSFIFQTEPYDDRLRTELLNGLKEYATSGVIGALGSIEAALELMHDSEINTKNVHTIAFRKNFDAPSTTLDLELFSKTHPMAIRLTNNDQVRKLQDELLRSRDLTDEGELGGRYCFRLQ